MKKGFTLIELLAVIVILAVIALIAVPIILDVVNEAKENSYKRSIELYGSAVEQAIARYDVNNASGTKLGLYVSDDSGKILTRDNIELTIEYTGSKVKCNVIIGNRGKIYMYNCYVDGNLVDYTYGDFDSDILLIDGNKGEIGSEYLVKVNNKEVFDFYLLSKNNNGTANLIMDRNICEDGSTNYTSQNNYCRFAWESNNINGNGPLVAMQKLYEATKNWNNIPNMNISYDDINDNQNSGYEGSIDYGYTGITITDGVGYITKKDGSTQASIELIDNLPIKARLASLKEVIDVGCIIYDSSTPQLHYGSCPVWLVRNVTYYDVSSHTGNNNIDKYSINNNEAIYQNKIYGYWLLSSNPVDASNARCVNYDGRIGSANSQATGGSGIRPVITVALSDLQ